MRPKKAKRKRKQVEGLIKQEWYDCSAKINLFLDVLAKREDGFHEINSIFAEVNLADKISIKLTEKPEIKISCTSKEIPDKENLVYKISSYLKDKYNVKKGVDIFLHKKIPLAAGLGGGSSDAAQTLKICNKLWNLNLSNNQLHEIAQKFGSDINFFLEGRIMRVSGRGEKIQPQPTNMQIKNILLGNPHTPISSKKAYSLVTPNKGETNKFKNVVKALQCNDLHLLSNNLYNSLESGIFAKYEKIKWIKNKLHNFGCLGSLMSGSGSTVFAIFKHYDNMLKAQDYFSKQRYWSYKTSLKN